MMNSMMWLLMILVGTRRGEISLLNLQKQRAGGFQTDSSRSKRMSDSGGASMPKKFYGELHHITMGAGNTNIFLLM